MKYNLYNLSVLLYMNYCVIYVLFSQNTLGYFLPLICSSTIFWYRSILITPFKIAPNYFDVS